MRLIKHIRAIASFPGLTQVSVACSMLTPFLSIFRSHVGRAWERGYMYCEGTLFMCHAHVSVLVLVVNSDHLIPNSLMEVTR